MPSLSELKSDSIEDEETGPEEGLFSKGSPGSIIGVNGDGGIMRKSFPLTRLGSAGGEEGAAGGGSLTGGDENFLFSAGGRDSFLASTERGAFLPSEEEEEEDEEDEEDEAALSWTEAIDDSNERSSIFRSFPSPITNGGSNEGIGGAEGISFGDALRRLGGEETEGRDENISTA